MFAEGADADNADIALNFGAHRTDADDIALDWNFECFGFTFAAHGENDGGADPATHFLNRFRQGQAEDRLIIQMGDVVARLDTGIGRRGVIDRGDHLDEAVLHGDLNAETAKFAAGLDPHVAEIGFVQIAGMRIERCQHAVDCCLDQFLVGQFRHIFRPYPLQHITEQGQLLIGFG